MIPVSSIFPAISKKAISLALVAMLAISAVGCSSNNDEAKTGKKNQKTTVENVDILPGTWSEDYTREQVKELYNKSYLLRVFKESTGLTVNNYILQKRILKAKNELRFTNKTLDLIATECGLEDANYFIRIFKKIEGITPGEYRKSW